MIQTMRANLAHAGRNDTPKTPSFKDRGSFQILWFSLNLALNLNLNLTSLHSD